MIRQISEAEFDEELRSFQRTAFRLETRDAYALSYERADFEAFLAGTPVPPTELGWWQPWLEQIASLTAEGKRVSRVRVTAEPPSPYQRWELWAAPWHAAAGEDIRYLPRSRAITLGLPLAEDWWLLDDERLIIAHFTSRGYVAGKTLITSPATVDRYCEWRDLAVSNATVAEEIAAA